MPRVTSRRSTELLRQQMLNIRNLVRFTKVSDELTVHVQPTNLLVLIRVASYISVLYIKPFAIRENKNIIHIYFQRSEYKQKFSSTNI